MSTKVITDPIAYTDAFKANVQGQLKARFRLDAEGAPMCKRSNYDRRIRHYTIDVSLKSPVAAQIQKVVYVIDDPTFVDPKGWSIDAANDFSEEVTTYGDVEIDVTVEMREGPKYKQRAWLSNMLENGHANNMTAEIREAIARIKVF